MKTKRLGYEHLEFWKGDIHPWLTYGYLGWALIISVGIGLDLIATTVESPLKIAFALASCWLSFCFYMKHRIYLV